MHAYFCFTILAPNKHRTFPFSFSSFSSFFIAPPLKSPDSRVSCASRYLSVNTEYYLPGVHIPRPDLNFINIPSHVGMCYSEEVGPVYTGAILFILIPAASALRQYSLDPQMMSGSKAGVHPGCMCEPHWIRTLAIHRAHIHLKGKGRPQASQRCLYTGPPGPGASDRSGGISEKNVPCSILNRFHLHN